MYADIRDVRLAAVEQGLNTSREDCSVQTYEALELQADRDASLHVSATDSDHERGGPGESFIRRGPSLTGPLLP